MRRCCVWLVVMLSMAFGSVPKEKVTPELRQVAYMIYGPSCIEKLEKGRHTQVEVPMKDGEPDMDNAVIVGVVATYNKSCGKIEIRREK